MINLESRDEVLQHDPKGMYAFTCGFPDQVRRALELSEAASLPQWSAKPDNVVLTGMGGSAAGGDYVKAMFEAFGKVPFVVNRDYTIPSWVGGGSLVFATSYSGNTEETIASYLAARKQGASLIVVTSGGKLAEMAREDGYPLIVIPGGQPPRTALGYLLMPVLHACIQMGLLPAQDWGQLDRELRAAVEAWSIEAEANEAKRLAAYCHLKPINLYGLGSWQGAVANRWKGQLCENSKCLAFCHTYPELCHNEILGWGNADQQCPNGWALVTLSDGHESAKMKKRSEVSNQLIAPKAENWTVTARGETLLERMLTLTLLGDFTSLYLAALYQVDPESIDAINILKAELSRVPG